VIGQGVRRFGMTVPARKLGVSDAKTEAAETNGHERHQIDTAAVRDLAKWVARTSEIRIVVRRAVDVVFLYHLDVSLRAHPSRARLANGVGAEPLVPLTDGLDLRVAVFEQHAVQLLDPFDLDVSHRSFLLCSSSSVKNA
jgi:hypothetical protein